MPEHHDPVGAFERLLVEQDERQVTPDAYKGMFRQHPAGVAVVTFSAPDGRPIGLTVTSVISVSAEPALLAFSIDARSSSWDPLASAGTVVVHLLDSADAHLAHQFARRGADRFAGVTWHRLATGEPVLSDAAAWLRARILQRTPAGNSYLITLRAVESHTARTGAPLVYHDRSYHRLGEHTQLTNAPHLAECGQGRPGCSAP
ncbi:flavin reductase family protein [Ruania halotolerans]|uniref:flavin reductase family protein n=1 Tax=Ruania halotolerans TaxID=2897773 RepID=UPI001E3D0079|nr:flavin reductase family protein [Ruania halotolerans]UFU07877.1 flavin reductase family protein [Ruania halotolerans]